MAAEDAGPEAADELGEAVVLGPAGGGHHELEAGARGEDALEHADEHRRARDRQEDLARQAARAGPRLDDDEGPHEASASGRAKPGSAGAAFCRAGLCARTSRQTSATLRAAQPFWTASGGAALQVPVRVALLAEGEAHEHGRGVLGDEDVAVRDHLLRASASRRRAPAGAIARISRGGALRVLVRVELEHERPPGRDLDAPRRKAGRSSRFSVSRASDVQTST